MSEDKRNTTVCTRVLKSGHSPILIDYRLRRVGGGWNIYDVTIEGVSLAVSYRATFNKKIRRNGIEALIDNLAVRNADGQRT